MMPQAATFILLVGLAAVPAVAQRPPDFAGEWRPINQGSPRPEPPRSDAPPPPRTVAFPVPLAADALKVTRRVESGGRDASYDFSYKLDGSETVNQMGPLVFHTKAVWEGQALVLNSNVDVEDKPIGTLRETYTLDGGKLMIETVRTGPAGTIRDRTVHEKVVRSPQ